MEKIIEPHQAVMKTKETKVFGVLIHTLATCEVCGVALDPKDGTTLFPQFDGEMHIIKTRDKKSDESGRD